MISPYIFGIHEPGGERHMLDAGKPGWIVFTETVNTGGKDFSHWADQGLGVICRLNHGYEPDGTLPHSSLYSAHAHAVAHYVRNSRGCQVWIIGNEPNAAWERPGSHDGEVITPALYARAYAACRDAILDVPGHEEDQVLIGAVAPWNDQTRYPGNPNGDWIAYFRDVLEALGPANCSGITIHAYTHGHHPDHIYSSDTMGPPFQQYHYHFRTYRDFMAAIPVTMRHLPVYLTEMDGDEPWQNTNNAWVQRAYAEINWWNQQPGNQQIRAAVLYRWPQIDKWYIEGKQGVIEDFRAALQQDYRWRAQVAPAPAAQTGYVTAPNGLRLRAGPSTATDTLLLIPYGAAVGVLGEVQDGWVGCQVGSLLGYVWSEYVAPEPPKPVGRAVGADLIETLAQDHNVEPALVRAVIAVESGQRAFINERLVIRFEPHIFFGYLTGNDVDRARQHFQIGFPKWDGDQHKLFLGGGWVAFHGNQDLEYTALNRARTFNPEWALLSTSMGAPQIMGFHWRTLGYDSAQSMFHAFANSEETQLRGMFTFMAAVGALAKLQAQDLLGFARIYNGTGQERKYAALIERAWKGPNA